jgi:hypothetical protein
MSNGGTLPGPDLFLRLRGHLLTLAVIVDAATAVLGVLSQHMFDMISRPIGYLLLMNPDCTMAMHASKSISRYRNGTGDADGAPFPDVTTRAPKFLFLLAFEHHVVWH